MDVTRNQCSLLIDPYRMLLFGLIIFKQFDFIFACHLRGRFILAATSVYIHILENNRFGGAEVESHV